jgi:hypothetical protein
MITERVEINTKTKNKSLYRDIVTQMREHDCTISILDELNVMMSTEVVFPLFLYLFTKWN